MNCKLFESPKRVFKIENISRDTFALKLPNNYMFEMN